MVAVGMSERDVIEWVAETYDRSVYEWDAQSGTRMFRVMWQGDAATPLLREISPYLKGKRRQAAIAIDFNEAKQRPAGKRASALTLEERDAYWSSMRALNESARERHDNGAERL